MNPEAQWTTYRTRFLVRARQLTEPLSFTDALGREQSGRSGDYLVESSDGMKRITSQALFEDIYVPLPQHADQAKNDQAKHNEASRVFAQSLPTSHDERSQVAA
jgi:hypothetical protein